MDLPKGPPGLCKLRSSQRNLCKARPFNRSRCKSSKKAKCPKWDAQESLDSFCDRLEIWNNVDPESKTKYLDFIDSLQESNRKKEKERCILEVRNKAIEPQDPDIIPKMIANLHKWFGKTKTDQFFGAWKDFIEIKLTDVETIEEFILKFDTIDSKLKSTDGKSKCI